MSETRICANCGAEHAIEDMYQVEGDWLCEGLRRSPDRNLRSLC